IYLEPENPIQPEPDYGDDADNGNDNDEGHAGDSNTDSDIDVGIGDDMTGSGGQDGTPSTPDSDSDLIEGEMPDKPVTPEDPIIDDGGDGSVDGTPGTKPDEDSDFVESIPDGSYDDDMNI
ncbi:hypothetical protein, partial [Vibrio harveyi]|uniref:hypothetical protein n=1 Tax=Vibrio harveyi TaxID=669 RepID=UPI00346ADB66